MNLHELTEGIAAHPELPLQFFIDGAPINGGYPVTEVKHAAITARDCGKHSEVERWSEFVIQLLDGSGHSDEHMSVAKFSSIVQVALMDISLGHETAHCKPYQRSLTAASSNSGCCGSPAKSSGCCG